jgi:hypothetical protein
VTGIAWVLIVASAALTPISVIALAMILVRSYGTSTSDPLGFLQVVVLPPASFVAGIALLRRIRWALYYAIALLTGVVAFNAYGFFRPPTPESVHVSASGVKTTTLASTGTYSIPAVVLAALALGTLLTRKVAVEFGAGRERGGPVGPLRIPPAGGIP